ncbi:DUF397 domain-containing protein [Sphaerisporangium sp. NPDC051011]|uniref:DUF397 domain-containing protein n=1 Tax=Sphaerisporangium sp. NPDC051011 TaxID=3155792 RepID=UPI00340698D5
MALSQARWRRSSYSGSDGGHCVEVAGNLSDIVAIRDSKKPQGPTITVAADEWRTFTGSLKAAHTTT